MSAEKTNVAAPPYDAHAGQTPIQPDQAYVEIPAQVPQQAQPLQPGMLHPSGYQTATPLHAIQRASAPVDCPVCHQREMTRVQFESGSTTHGWAAVLCLCACIGCLPYMISSLKDVNHYCAKCNALLVTWHNSGRVEVIQKQK